jgi:hypothetical protein
VVRSRPSPGFAPVPQPGGSVLLEGEAPDLAGGCERPRALAAVSGIGAEPEVTPRGCYVPASVCRPRSVIVSHVTSIGRPPACTVPGVAVAAQSLDSEAVRQHDRLGAPERRADEQSECPVLLAAAAALSWFHRHWMPSRISTCPRGDISSNCADRHDGAHRVETAASEVPRSAAIPEKHLHTAVGQVGLLVEAGRRGVKAHRLSLCNSGDTAGSRDRPSMISDTISGAPVGGLERRLAQPGSSAIRAASLIDLVTSRKM